MGLGENCAAGLSQKSIKWKTRMFKMLKSLLLFVLFCLLASCANYTQETFTVRNHFQSGQYTSALEDLNKSSISTTKRNRLLFHLEKSLIHDQMGERAKAREELFEADRISDELFTVSVVNTAASFIISDSSTDYGGEDYEKIAIHIMLALSYLEEGDFKKASVEARKIDSKFKQITEGREENYNKYHEDGFARFLAGLLFEKEDYIDSAIIEYNKALKIFENPNYQIFFSGTVPNSLVTSLYRLALKRNRSDILNPLRKKYEKITEAFDVEALKNPTLGSLVVIHETGFIARKVAKEFFLPISGQLIRFSFPFISYPSSISSYNLGVLVQKTQTYYPSENVSHLDSIAHYSLEDKRGRMILKAGTRLLIKGQLTNMAYQNFGQAGGLLANLASAVTESADTRSWTLLPKAFYITRVNLPAGMYQVEIKNNGALSGIETVTLKKGDLVMLRDKKR